MENNLTFVAQIDPDGNCPTCKRSMHLEGEVTPETQSVMPVVQDEFFPAAHDVKALTKALDEGAILIVEYKNPAHGVWYLDNEDSKAVWNERANPSESGPTQGTPEIGSPEWADSAERSEWKFVANMLEECMEVMPHKLSGAGVAFDIAKDRAKEGWRTVYTRNATSDARIVELEEQLATARVLVDHVIHGEVDLGSLPDVYDALKISEDKVDV